MNFVLDVHTHTIASGHAYSTLMENIVSAKERGLELLGVSDHCPNMPGGPHEFYFGNLKTIPPYVNGIRIIKGCEANIINYKGDIDLSLKLQKRMELIIASLHEVCIKPGSRRENTEAFKGAMDNPLVDVIGHSGNPAFPIYEEEVVSYAKEKNVLIELNNGSFTSRAGSETNCLKIARLCKEYGASIILGTDSHFCTQIGDFSKVASVVNEVGFSEELIMNTSKEKLLNFLKVKGNIKI